MSRLFALGPASKIACALLLSTSLALAQTPAAAPEGDAAANATELRMQAYSLFPGGTADKQRAIALFEQAAEAGDADSMAFLGSLYLNGDGVPADRAIAIGWYARAAQTGHLAAIARLAELAGASSAPPPPPVSTPVPVQHAAPAAWAPSAAQVQAREAAQALLDGYEKPEEGFAAMLELAEAGDPEAMFSIGVSYGAGIGVDMDGPKSFEWLKKAADAGEVEAMFPTSEMLWLGLGDVPPDRVMAKDYLQRARIAIEGMDFGANEAWLIDLSTALAASDVPEHKSYGASVLLRLAESGAIPAMLKYAETASRPAERIYWLEEAATFDDGAAMSALGAAYMRGTDVRRNLVSAENWFRLAANAGVPQVAELQAEFDETVKANLDELVEQAVDLYLDASDEDQAELSRAKTLLDLAIRYEDSEAKYWLARILTVHPNGDADAQRAFSLMTQYVYETDDATGLRRLSELHESGTGTEVDMDKALYYFRLALEAGDDDAPVAIERITLALGRPALPEATMPPSDRWGAFQLDGDYAVGVSAGDAYFGVACQTGGGLYFEYNSGRALHADVASEEMSWLVLLTNTNTQAANVPTTLVHTVSDPAVVANWIDLVAKANSVKIGLSPDPRLREFVLVNASDFSARGSSSALKELREKCAPV